MRGAPRELLSETDLLFTDVLLEPVLPYDATADLGRRRQGGSA